MRYTLLVHIVAGGMALLSGYVALYAAKGGALHRKSGMLFVCTMLIMAGFGGMIAAVHGVAAALNVPVALLTIYLVVTSLATVRPPAAGARPLLVAGLLIAAGVAVADLTFAAQAIANGGKRNGMPAFPFVMFGIIATLGVIGDLRVLASGPLQGARRLARHLWRMTFALLIAALSFFIGQAKVIPEPIRIMPLLALPVLAVLVTLLYWLWRVRVRRSTRGLSLAVPEEVAA